VERFKKLFSQQAWEVKGRGWCWLVYNNNRVIITTTRDNDNPLMNTVPDSEQGFPILCLDTWEHAYGEQYGDNFTAYVGSFWRIVNWDFANERFARFRDKNLV
jgi:Fe-Mn family superoxide dismutase